MESIAKLKPEFVRTFDDPNAGLKAFLVIDRRLHGSATGGIRMAEDVTLDEVANLAHEMTLKFAFLSIKKDGAKAGIVSLPNITPIQKRSLCCAFGSAIKELVQEGTYSPGQDIGINAEEFSAIRSGFGMDGIDGPASFPSNYFTALTVYLSLKTLLEAHNVLLEKSTVLLEGFGKVSEQLAKLLVKAGATIRGVSTIYGGIYNEQGLPLDELFRLKHAYGDRWVTSTDAGKFITCEKLILQEADVLIPGARPDTINERNAGSVKARFIVPIANIPATEQVEDLLFKHGIRYLPGFVTNCGGVLSFFLAEQSFNTDAVEEIIRTGFPLRLHSLINRASKENQSFSWTARRITDEHLASMVAEKKKIFIKKYLSL